MDEAKRVRLGDKPTYGGLHADLLRLWGRPLSTGDGKGKRTCRGPGVRPSVCGKRERRLEPEALLPPSISDDGKRRSSRVQPARGELRVEGCRSGLEVMTGGTTQPTLSVRPYFDRACSVEKGA